MTLPSNVGTGYVTGTFMDSAGALAAGTITFTQSPAKILDATASPPTTILPRPVTVTLVSGTFTQALVATDDVDLNPTGWTYLVSFNLTIAGAAVAVSPFSIRVPQGLIGAAVDLTLVSPAVSSNGSLTFPTGGGSGGVGYCIEAGGVYPGRPAGAAPVIFFGPDAPSGGGTTAGGAGAVNGLDTWQVTVS